MLPVLKQYTKGQAKRTQLLNVFIFASLSILLQINLYAAPRCF